MTLVFLIRISGIRRGFRTWRNARSLSAAIARYQAPNAKPHAKRPLPTNEPVTFRRFHGERPTMPGFRRERQR